MEVITNQAIELIRKSCQPDGIYASPLDQDNYKRVWARDSILAGIAGLIVNDHQIISHLKEYLLINLN